MNNTPVAAEDVYAFLELFFARYPEYAAAPFHVAAESYGGTYAPHIASVIHAKNAELKSASYVAPTPAPKHINLASVILANGQTEPRTQMGSVPDYVCNGPFPVYDDPEGPQCQALRSKVPTCQRLISGCYNFNSRFTCVPAILYCYSQIMGPLQREYCSIAQRTGSNDRRQRLVSTCTMFARSGTYDRFFQTSHVAHGVIS